MRILGIDPGIGRMGWGIIDCTPTTVNAIDFGCIETASTLAIPERLVALYDALQGILQEHKPDELGIEELFFNTNAKTAFVVGQARGVILLTAAQRDMPIAIYTPLQVKMSLTGYGRAEKGQVGQMVKTILKLDAIPKPDDTADALAIAITHMFSYKYARKKNAGS